MKGFARFGRALKIFGCIYGVLGFLASNQAVADSALFVDGFGTDFEHPGVETFLTSTGSEFLLKRTTDTFQIFSLFVYPPFPISSLPNDFLVAEFKIGNAVPLRPGKFLGAMSSSFNNLWPTIGTSASYHACPTRDAWFDIREISVDGSGNILNAAIDYLRPCGVSYPQSPMREYGAIRINSTIPYGNSQLYALAGRDQVADTGWTVRLDGSQSYEYNHVPLPEGALTFTWRQLSGIRVRLINATTPNPTFEAPVRLTVDGPEKLVFELTVTDSSGRSDTDQVTVSVFGQLARQTRAYYSVQRSNAQGSTVVSKLLTESDYVGVVSSNYQTFTGVFLGGPGELILDGKPPAGDKLKPGLYENAVESGVDNTRPSISIGIGYDTSAGYGSQCTATTGAFKVLEIATYPKPVEKNFDLRSFAVDYDIQCAPKPNGGHTSELIHGSIRYNSAIPLHAGIGGGVVKP